jgi:molybdopterin molybdotransferase
MIPVSEARRLIREHTARLEPKWIPLENALRSVLASDVLSPIDMPSFPQSSMDGYAFAHLSLSDNDCLTVIGTMAAGTDRALQLRTGEAVRIFTGAPLPEGADTVVMQEKSERRGDSVSFSIKPAKGENVRRPGTEALKGEVALQAGRILSPAGIGFLSGLGLKEVQAYPTPSVTILVTGDELLEPGEPLTFGRVYESNSRSLTAALRGMGVERIRKTVCRDDLDALRAMLDAEMQTSDLVLVTGGVSVGDYDHVVQAAERCGVEQVFHRVRQKPGKPLFFGVRGGRPVFGLPGNPASVLTCFHEYVRPSIERMRARPDATRTVRARLQQPVRKPAGLTHFLKARFEGEGVSVLDGQESYRLNAFANANCLVVLDEETTGREAGDEVEIHPLPDY